MMRGPKLPSNDDLVRVIEKYNDRALDVTMIVGALHPELCGSTDLLAERLSYENALKPLLYRLVKQGRIAEDRERNWYCSINGVQK
jgi:hypothetical protein